MIKFDNKNIRLFLISAFLLCTLSTYAYDFRVKGVYYNKLGGDSVAVTYKGKYERKCGKYSRRITIPATVTYKDTTYRVTKLDGTFFRCPRLKSVTIPNSITNFGILTFEECPRLEKPVYNDHTFGRLPTTYQGEYIIPDGIKTIADDAFFGCVGLTSIIIPNSVTSIGHRAFSGCKKLTSITLPNNIRKIGSCAFAETSITSIILPDTIEDTYGIFWNCSTLTSVTLPNRITVIRPFMFTHCQNLTSVEIPNSVTRIDAMAFMGCTKLTSIIIPNSITQINDFAFADCSNLKTVVFPNSVTKVKNHIFSNCNNLKRPIYNQHLFAHLPPSYSGEYYIPDGIKTIADAAFVDCDSLTSVIIPTTVTSIGYRAFEGCYSLSSVIVPNGVTEINVKSFANCSNLQTIILPESVTKIRWAAFEGCNNVQTFIINAITPPILDLVGCDSWNPNATIFVPAGTLEAYKSTKVWRDFPNIQELKVENE